jgi:multidrug efflux pump
VVLLGTFGVLAAFGFSINTLTMFGMALSIGLLVDDAIVVVENVERVMAEEGLNPREATRKSMNQITGALVAIALVLGAVFVPMAFFGGSIGVIYRQFSITLVSAMALSVLVALILTPALCASILKPLPPSGHVEHKGFFRWFNVARSTRASSRATSAARPACCAGPERSMLVYVAIVRRHGRCCSRAILELVPAGRRSGLHAYGQVHDASRRVEGASPGQLLDAGAASTLHRHREGRRRRRAHRPTATTSPARARTPACLFIKLRDWDERKKCALSVRALARRRQQVLQQHQEAHGARQCRLRPCSSSATPPGFDLMLQNRGGLDRAQFLAARNQLLGAAAQDPRLAGVRPNGVEDAPQFKLDIDREKASALGVSVADINSTLQTGWASTYVNDFIDRGRVKRVYVQGDPGSRMQPDDLNRWYVRNKEGGMVPFSAFGHGEWTYGPQKLVRFNGVPAYQIQGGPAPGKSSGEAMKAMEELVAKLPRVSASSGTASRTEEKTSGSQAPMLYALSLAIVFLCLAALYESWSIPRPCCSSCRSAYSARSSPTLSRGLLNDAYFQVGPARDHRTRRQERDPHRRVRQGEFRPRHEPRRLRDARRRSSACGPFS